jgi:hypothetical protein
MPLVYLSTGWLMSLYSIIDRPRVSTLTHDHGSPILAHPVDLAGHIMRDLRRLALPTLLAKLRSKFARGLQRQRRSDNRGRDRCRAGHARHGLRVFWDGLYGGKLKGAGLLLIRPFSVTINRPAIPHQSLNQKIPERSIAVEEAPRIGKVSLSGPERLASQLPTRRLV